MEALQELASAQAGVVARWQALAVGLPRWTVDAWAARQRTVFPGVYVTGWAPVTAEQRRWAAALTAPGTVLCDHSAAAIWELGDELPGLVTTVRAGARGPWRTDGLRVRFSRTLDGHVTRRDDGPLVTTAPRTVVDLWPALPSDEAREKLLREALRRRAVSLPALRATLTDLPGARGSASLRTTVEGWRRLPFLRCRSDAEAFALTVLDGAGVEIPAVNVWIAGFEADLVWTGLRRIVELDGPSYHRLKDTDARRTRAWVAAAFRVDRLPTDLLFADPGRLLRLAPPPVRQRRRTSRSSPSGRRS